jgi:MFS family permease
VPYAADLGRGPVAVGVLIAALPAGSAIGALLLVRIPPRLRMRLIGPAAVGAALPMIACLSHPGLAVSIALWALTGMFAAYQVPSAASFVRSVPDRNRGQVIGLVASGLVAIQGVGIVCFGVVAGHVGAARAIALAGIGALAAASLLSIAWARVCRADETDETSGGADGPAAATARTTEPTDAR